MTLFSQRRLLGTKRKTFPERYGQLLAMAIPLYLQTSFKSVFMTYMFIVVT